MKFSLMLFLIFAIPAIHPGEVMADEKKSEKKEEKKEKGRVKEVGAEELHQALEMNLKLILIDTRKKGDFDDSHIFGSVSLSDVTAETLAEIVPDKKQRVVFYCEDEDCSSAPAAAAKALDLGYEKVYDYRAGFSYWKTRGFSIAP